MRSADLRRMVEPTSVPTSVPRFEPGCEPRSVPRGRRGCRLRSAPQPRHPAGRRPHHPRSSCSVARCRSTMGHPDAPDADSTSRNARCPPFHRFVGRDDRCRRAPPDTPYASGHPRLLRRRRVAVGGVRRDRLHRAIRRMVLRSGRMRARLPAVRMVLAARRAAWRPRSRDPRADPHLGGRHARDARRGARGGRHDPDEPDGARRPRRAATQGRPDRRVVPGAARGVPGPAGRDGREAADSDERRDRERPDRGLARVVDGEVHGAQSRRHGVACDGCH